MNYTLEDIKKQSPYPIGELNTAYAKYFVGNSYLYSINDQEVLISNVTFEPGCRNNWHIHHGAGQILLCTAGRGYSPEWGKPAQELNVGDTVYIAPEIKHWHGAAPESAVPTPPDTLSTALPKFVTKPPAVLAAVPTSEPAHVNGSVNTEGRCAH